MFNDTRLIVGIALGIGLGLLIIAGIIPDGWVVPALLAQWTGIGLIWGRAGAF